MLKSGTLLIIDDDQDILTTARIILRPYFELITTFDSPNAALNWLKFNTANVALIDMNFSIGDVSGEAGLSLLGKLQSEYPNLSVVTNTAYGSIDLAVETIKNGAIDFVVKPWDNEKLIATLVSAYKLSASKNEITSLKSKQKAFVQILDQPKEQLLGNSAQIQSVLKTIEKVAKTDANVLILGENGTGKSLAANLIHNHSERQYEPFIQVDLGSISESLFESEMFGHKKGAFTDAKEDRIGRFELADNGTLFLDEIGNLPLALQAKLLTAIEQRNITPIGGNQPVPVNIRIISATNQNIFETVQKNGFREDLLYRLNTIEITLPPLRDRREDIPLIAGHYLKLLSKKYKHQLVTFDESALKKLSAHSWPGNIRELKHAIERAVIMSESSVLSENDFTHLSSKQEIRHKPKRMDEIEKESIKSAIIRFNGNLSTVAKELGMGRTTLYRKIEKYGL